MSKYSNFPRKKSDFYPTPLKAAQPLFDHLNKYKGSYNRFIEPCAGDGRLVTLIEKHTDLICTYISDIDPQANIKGTRSGDLVFQKTDVLNEDWDFITKQTNTDVFITNPPWVNTKASGNLRLSIIQKLSNCKPTWLLLAGNYIYNENMWTNFNNDIGVMYYCQKILPVGRVEWEESNPDSGGAGKQDAAWYLFDRSKITGGPQILPRGNSI